MSKQTIILIIISLVCGSAAVYLSRSYVNDEISSYKQNIDKQYKPVKVVVAKRPISRGELLSVNVLAVRDMPKAFVHSDAIRPGEIDTVLGFKMVYGLGQGESLLSSHVGSTKGASFSNLIEAGKRAITFPVDTLSSISGMITPGDHIDLFATLDNGGIENTLPIITNIIIIATGVVTDEVERSGSKSNRNYQNITLHVAPLVAAQIAHARSVGSLMITLRSRGDNTPLDLKPVTTRTLLGKSAYRKVPVIGGVTK